MGSSQVNSFQDEAEFGGIHFDLRSILSHTGRPEGPFFKSFCKYTKPASVPEQNSDVVASLVEENKKMALKGITVKHLAHGGNKPVKAFAHVDRRNSSKDFCGRR